MLEKLHVRPDQVVDYKALVGDKSDNIPGVAGVGEKTTENLLAKYGTLDAIYAHLEEIEPRWRTKLEAGKESAYMSYKLAAIRTDLPITVDLEQARTEVFDPTKVEAIFHELEFRSLVEKLRKMTGESAPAGTQQLSLFEQKPQQVSESRPLNRSESKVNTIIVDSVAGLESLARILSGSSPLTPRPPRPMR